MSLQKAGPSSAPPFLMARDEGLKTKGERGWTPLVLRPWSFAFIRSRWRCNVARDIGARMRGFPREGCRSRGVAQRIGTGLLVLVLGVGAWLGIPSTAFGCCLFACGNGLSACSQGVTLSACQTDCDQTCTANDSTCSSVAPNLCPAGSVQTGCTTDFPTNFCQPICMASTPTSTATPIPTQTAGPVPNGAAAPTVSGENALFLAVGLFVAGLWSVRRFARSR